MAPPGRQPKQPPSPICVAQDPVGFFRSNDQAIVKRFTCHQVVRHFYRQETHRAIAYQSVGRAGNAENRREMARRSVKDCFRKEKRTGSLRARFNDIAIKALRVNNPAV